MNNPDITRVPDDTYLVRLPNSFPLSTLALAVNRHGYRIRFVTPKDLRSRSLWEFIPDHGKPIERPEPGEKPT